MGAIGDVPVFAHSVWVQLGTCLFLHILLVTTSSITTNTYDSRGNVLTSTADSDVIIYAYDGRGNVVHTLNPEIIDLYFMPFYGKEAPFSECDINNDGLVDFTDLMSFNNAYPIVQNYYYSPFGEVWQGEKANDTNNFRYAGEYHDSETGSIYLRARYYNPSTGRFITVDPIKDGTNWYVYCSNNPIMFVDPWGLKIIIKGTEEEVEAIFNDLSTLTDDTLSLKPVENEDNKYEVVIDEKNEGEHPDGTKLVRRLIENPDGTPNEKTCTIRYDSNEQNSHTPSGENSRVVYNPYDLSRYTKNLQTGEIAYENRPMNIALAHELIHADRHFRGVTLDKKSTVAYTYPYAIHDFSYTCTDLRYNYQKAYTSKEELATVGIRYDSDDDITENMIRAEQDLNERVQY